MTRNAHAASRAPAPVAARSTAQAPELSRLFTYNLSLLANMLSRGAAARYSREFGVTLMEWRVIGSLALDAPLSLQQISHRFDLDKGQSSRTVAGLLERGLVHRGVNGDDRRSLSLRLTPAGWRLYRRIVNSARARSERLLGCLDAGERKAFLRTFGKLMGEARVIYAEERSRPNGPGNGRAYSGLRKPHA
jgi:DNA-binding MarR family transcriptional regulator